MDKLTDKERKFVNNMRKQTITEVMVDSMPKPKEELNCKNIGWTSNAEWQCPFCHRLVSNGLSQCGDKKIRGCSAFRVLYGNLDFAYKSINGRIGDTASIDRMKEIMRGL